MFGIFSEGPSKKDKKSQVAELETLLETANQNLIEASQKRSDIFVIKLFPDNPDDFELNGTSASNKQKAVYGQHKLSFSEAVMFKAGQEVAKRDADKIIEEIVSKNQIAAEVIERQDKELQEANERCRKLVKQLNEQANASKTSKAAEAAKVRENASKESEKIAELTTLLTTLEEENKQAASERDYWKLAYFNGLPVNLDEDVVTPWGIVKALRK